jgi:hypothetical protein
MWIKRDKEINKKEQQEEVRKEKQKRNDKMQMQRRKKGMNWNKDISTLCIHINNSQF